MSKEKTRIASTQEIISVVRSLLEKEPTDDCLDMCEKIIANRKKIHWKSIKYDNGGGSLSPVWDFEGGAELQEKSYKIFSRGEQ